MLNSKLKFYGKKSVVIMTLLMSEWRAQQPIKSLGGGGKNNR